jgi:hypothetical protein
MRDGGCPSVARPMEVQSDNTIQELFEKACLSVFHDQEGESMYRSGLLNVSFYGKSHSLTTLPSIFIALIVIISRV